jgi:peptidoglycan/LPS O-acetylase OafA/YrhL
VNLSRITSGGRLIPEIDGLRFVAIISVVAFHIAEYLHARLGIDAPGLLGTALGNGARGVPLFFVISGFVLGRPFAMHYLQKAKAPKLKDYFLRRLTRLEPPYLIAILAVFFGLLAFTGRDESAHLLASLGYSHNLIYGAPNPFFGLAWSLEIEVQFYCLVPLLAMIYRLPRTARRALLIALMFAGASRLFAMPDRISYSFLGWIQCFAAGFLLADLYVDGWSLRKHWAFDLLSFALWPAVFLLNVPLAWILLPSLSLILYVSAFRSVIFQKFFTSPAIVTIGGMCYTIYLVHYPVISAAGRLFKNPAMFVSLALLGIAAASLVFFVLIERPCMDKNWPLLVWNRFNRHREGILH